MSRSYIHTIVGGSVYDPDLPYNLIFILDFSRTCIIFLAFLTLLRLAINLLSMLIGRSRYSIPFPAYSPFHGQFLVLLSLILGIYGTSCIYQKPSLAPYELTIERLDPRLDGMRVVMLSDIHISSPTNINDIVELVYKVNALRPDLIVMPGDLIDGTVPHRQAIVRELFNLQAPMGVFITTGNHEYYSGYQAWRNFFEAGGFTSLDNKVVALKDPQGKTLLNLAGLTDPKATLYGLPMPDVPGVVSSLDPQVPSLILSHRPAYAHDLSATINALQAQAANALQAPAASALQTQAASAVPAASTAAVPAASTAAVPSVDLIFSGHTHGGLVKGMDQFFAQLNGGFVSGAYRVGESELVVGNGLMVWSGFPLRLGVPSQVVLVTLHSGQTAVPDELKLTQHALYKREQLSKLTARANQDQNPNPMGSRVRPRAVGTAGTTSTIYTAGAAHANKENKSTCKESALLGVTGSPANSDKLRGLQLILPMVDTSSGAITETVTNLALLPDNLTTEQQARIIAILNEAAANPSPVSHAATGTASIQAPAFTTTVLKESTTNLQQNHLADPFNQRSVAADTANYIQVKPGQMTLGASSVAAPSTSPAANADSAKTDSTKTNSADAAASTSRSASLESAAAYEGGNHDPQETMAIISSSANDTVTQDLIQYENDEEDVSAELQTEYAISLGTDIDFNDGSVTTTEEAPPASPKSASDSDKWQTPSLWEHNKLLAYGTWPALGALPRCQALSSANS